jgi:hypothetical protein
VRVLARAIGDRMMQVKLRLQGKVVSALGGIKAAGHCCVVPSLNSVGA